MKYLVIEVWKGDLQVYRTNRKHGKLITTEVIDNDCLIAENTGGKVVRICVETKDLARDEIREAVNVAVTGPKNGW